VSRGDGGKGRQECCKSKGVHRNLFIEKTQGP
jgi:hypothetical protein